jgi:hypothetical protein
MAPEQSGRTTRERHSAERRATIGRS